MDPTFHAYLVVMVEKYVEVKHGGGWRMVDSTTLDDNAELFVMESANGKYHLNITVGPAYKFHELMLRL